MTRTKKVTKKATTKKAKVVKVERMNPPFLITAAEYEGALKARRVIKNELDPKLQDPKLFARYCYFNQLIDLYEAQQSGNYLSDPGNLVDDPWNHIAE